MNWKIVYTKIFLKELGMDITEGNIKECLTTWWQNTRNKDSGGLRLTNEGFNALKDTGIQIYEIPYSDDLVLTTQVIIHLDKFIDSPYYIGKKSITVTDSKKAVELSLFSGNVRKYGLAKAMRLQK